MNAECRGLLCEVLPYVACEPGLTRRIEALLRQDVATDGGACGEQKQSLPPLPPGSLPIHGCGCQACRGARELVEVQKG